MNPRLFAFLALCLLLSSSVVSALNIRTLRKGLHVGSVHHQTQVPRDASTIGCKVTIVEAGLNQVAASALPRLLSQLQSASIGDVSGDSSGFSYDLTSIRIDSVNMDAIQISSSASSGLLTLSITGLSVDVKLNWHYRMDSWPHVEDSGNADASTSGSTMTLNLGITSVNGVPQVTSTSASVNLNNFNINIGGAWYSFLYNLLDDLFQGSIRDSVQSSIADSVTQNVQSSTNRALANVQWLVPVDSTAEIDFSLPANPIFTDSAIVLPSHGEFYQTVNKQEAPYTAAALPDTVNSAMLQLIMSEYVALSAGSVYYTAGRLTGTVTDADVPSNFPVRLNTNSFQVLIPPLYAKYPGQSMVLNILATQAPSISITSSGISVELIGAMSVDVIDPATSNLVETMVIGLDITTSGSVQVSSSGSTNTLTGNMQFLNVATNLIKSDIGAVSQYLTGLQDIISLLCTEALVPHLNKLLLNGFVLPNVNGVTFISPQVVYGDGFLAVTTSISYNPPA